MIDRRPKMTIRWDDERKLWIVWGTWPARFGRAPWRMAARVTKDACQTFIRDAHTIFTRCGVK
jgi:hypothetical protein